MKRKSSTLPRHRSHLTAQQRAVLILAGLLVAAWIAAGAFFVFSSRPVKEPGAGQGLDGSSAAAPALTARPTPSQGDSLPTAAASCAQQARAFQQGVAIGVPEPGILAVNVDGQTLQISLAGIELPPASSQREQLSQVMRAVAEGQPVLLVQDVSSQDSPGQLERYVFVGDQFLNEIVVRQGLALAARGAPGWSCAALLQQAEAQARIGRAGLWQPSPVPTSTFMPFVTLNPATQAVCDCSKEHTCSDFTTQAEAQICYNACNDYNSKLDFDRDGKACETLP